MLELAAKKGEVKAYYKLADMFENGIGVPVNIKEAIKLYALAADANIP